MLSLLNKKDTRFVFKIYKPIKDFFIDGFLLINYQQISTEFETPKTFILTFDRDIDRDIDAKTYQKNMIIAKKYSVAYNS